MNDDEEDLDQFLQDYSDFCYDPQGWVQNMIDEGALPPYVQAPSGTAHLEGQFQELEKEFRDKAIKRQSEREQEARRKQQERERKALNERSTPSNSFVWWLEPVQTETHSEPRESTLPIPTKDIRIAYFDYKYPGLWKPSHPELIKQRHQQKTRLAICLTAAFCFTVTLAIVLALVLLGVLI